MADKPMQSHYQCSVHEPCSRIGNTVCGQGLRPPEADDFLQLKGYLDVTSGILGGHGPLGPPPLKSASVYGVLLGS